MTTVTIESVEKSITPLHHGGATNRATMSQNHKKLYKRVIFSPFAENEPAWPIENHSQGRGRLPRQRTKEQQTNRETTTNLRKIVTSSCRWDGHNHQDSMLQTMNETGTPLLTLSLAVPWGKVVATKNREDKESICLSTTTITRPVLHRDRECKGRRRLTSMAEQRKEYQRTRKAEVTTQTKIKFGISQFRVSSTLGSRLEFSISFNQKILKKIH